MGAEEPVEIAGLQLTFELDEKVVKVWDAAADRWVGNAFSFNRADGPLLYPSYAYREKLGTSAGDPHGSANRDQIASRAKKILNPEQSREDS